MKYAVYNETKDLYYGPFNSRAEAEQAALAMEGGALSVVEVAVPER